jgi:DNA repair exonuclease SbcCD ATPase subunit
MKRALKITAGLLVLFLLLYVALGCLVYCYYEPNIKSLIADVELEASRQDGWDSAIAEIEEECRRLGVTQKNVLSAQERQRDRLQQAVKDEKIRRSHLQKDIRGRLSRSSMEWNSRTEERLAQAQQALAEFKGPKKDAKVEAEIQALRQRLEALRDRKQALQSKQERLNLMIEWRDKLKIWPLPMIDRFVDGEETPKEN